MSLFLICLLVFVTGWWVLRQRKKTHAVDALPGPTKLPLFGTSIVFLTKGREAAFQMFNECATLYYPLYRTWQGSVPVAHPLDPKHVELVLSSSQHIAKSHDYDFMVGWLGNSMLITKGSKWHSRRKLLTPAFHFSILEQFVPVFSDKTCVLVSKLRETRGQNVDITPLVTRCALDIICQTAMGTDIDAQRDLDSPYVKAVYEVSELVIHRMLRPWLYSSWAFKLTKAGKRHDECIKILHDFSKKVIKERRTELEKSNFEVDTEELTNGEGRKKKTAFLNLILKANRDGASMSDEDIREEVDTFMFAGHDTTAMAMSWALLFLGAHPQIQARCVSELMEIFGDSNKRDPSLSDLNSMKYLERVIKESLRLRPSVAFIGRQLENTLHLEKRRLSLCVGCGAQIHDQYILRVAPDLEWHAACLKCAECHQFLDENCTCFVRDGKTYCKRDYVRLFGTKCDKCGLSFSKNDFVMRAKTKIYHIDCFRCTACERQLIPGDEFALRDDGLFCKEDHEVLEKAVTCVPSENNNNVTIVNNNNSNSRAASNHEGSNSDSSESGSTKVRDSSSRGGGTGSGGGRTKGSSDGKPTRVRTVLNEKQLHTLRTCYNANPRPDALMKEQLVEMTSLSPRVIRVWFQNKRCKDKKRQIQMKLQMQQEKDGGYDRLVSYSDGVYCENDGRKLNYGSMQGIPMVASSPVRHESPLGMNPIEVQSYQPPWKALSDFALHTDLDRLDPTAPPFQQLVSQMHGYDLHGGPPPPPPPTHEMVGGPPGGAPDLGHPDSTDSYVTYLESDDSLQHDAPSP